MFEKACLDLKKKSKYAICLDLDLHGICNSQECIQQMTQHLTKINMLPSLSLLLILDSQSKIPSKNTLWPLVSV